MLGFPVTISRRLVAVAVPVALTLGLAVPALTTAAGPYTCAGSFAKPGVLSGGYPSGVIVKGVCEVSAGYATVNGTLQVTPGGVLAAAFGRNFRTHAPGSGLRVNGGILAQSGSTLILGCGPKVFVCLDDHGARPTLSGHEMVSGGIDAQGSLGVLVYNTTIGGDVGQKGGGGGGRCAHVGPFARFGTAVYTTYANDTVRGVLDISHLTSCFMAISHVHVAKSMSLIADKLANPDAIEVTSNTVGGNLVCRRNSSVWDSEGYHPHKAYPRLPKPNKVKGTRAGQCALATPVAKGQAAGPGPF